MSKPGCPSHPYIQVQTAACEWNDSWVCCPFLFGDREDEGPPRSTAVSHTTTTTTNNSSTTTNRLFMEPHLVRSRNA